MLPDVIRSLIALKAPKILAASAQLFRRLELDSRTLARSVKVFGQVLEGGRQLSREDLRAELEKVGVPTRGELWYRYIPYMRRCTVSFAAVRNGANFTYALFNDRAPNAWVLIEDDAVVELTHRYFVSRRPAIVHDFAKWSWLPLHDAGWELRGAGRSLKHVRLTVRRISRHRLRQFQTRPNQPRACCPSTTNMC